MRRLPIYLVVGTGASMRGEPIESVKNGIQMLISALRKDPWTHDAAWISIITFGDVAVQKIPLMPLKTFRMPDFEIEEGSVLGSALQLLCLCREKEAVRSTPTKRGDCRPMVFVFSDGTSTDDLQLGVEKIHSMKWDSVVCCATGPNANVKLLQEVSHECVIELVSAVESTLSAFLRWPEDDDLIEKIPEPMEDEVVGELPPLPPPPAEVTIVGPGDYSESIAFDPVQIVELDECSEQTHSVQIVELDERSEMSAHSATPIDIENTMKCRK